MLFPNANTIITGTKPDTSFKDVDNLNDGAYYADRNKCYVSDKVPASHIFVMVKFPSVVKVSSVTIRNQHAGDRSNLFVNFEIRVGNYSSQTDFHRNELFTKIVFGDIDVNDKDYLFTANQPVYGKYVTLEELEGDQMRVCILEIF